MNEVRPLSLVVCLLFIFAGAAMITGSQAAGWHQAGYICFVIAGLAALWIPAAALLSSRAGLIDSEARFVTAYNGADPETRAALGLKYPRLRVRLDGDAVVTVDYSGVELKWFREFMLDSDPVYISAEGHWGDKTIARKQWYLWYKYLVDEHAIIEQSQAGSRTWRWRSQNEYRRFMAYVTMRIPADMVPDEVRVPDDLQPIPEPPPAASIEHQFQTDIVHVHDRKHSNRSMMG
jgi:hypothetical protein